MRNCILCRFDHPVTKEAPLGSNICYYCKNMVFAYEWMIMEVARRFMKLSPRTSKCLDCFGILDICAPSLKQEEIAFINEVLVYVAQEEYKLGEEEKAAKKVLVDSPPYLVCGDAFSIIAEYQSMREDELFDWVYSHILVSLRILMKRREPDVVITQ